MILRSLLLVGVLAMGSFGRADWPGFRGDGSSSAPAASPPGDWSIEEGRNVAWTADLPGQGVSGPIVVGGRVFLTASGGPNRERLHVLAFDAATGERLWSRRLWATGRTNCHSTSANAAPTPASDGARVFVFYSSSDLAAFSLAGDVLWARGLTLNHPGVGNDIGMASSPVVAGEALVVQAECQGESFALGVDRRTGETLWEIDRPQVSNWASPLPWVTSSGVQSVWLQNSDGAVLVDAKSGEQLAEINAECGSIPSPSPGGTDKLVLTTGGVSVFAEPFDEPMVQAPKLKPGSSSPVVVGEALLAINRGGVLVCSDLASGDMIWRKRIGGTHWATPVAGGGKLYCVSSEGVVKVLDLNDGGSELAEIPFGEDIYGSPAISDDAIYFRSSEHLWKIAAPRQAADPSNATR
ncbi:outer membrane biogenesis protein BamB [Planctomycetes bacterium MalM25]|nr:outer membrane biogenesis protein BamB [Planctomycetes bacterium MalM25]